MADKSDKSKTLPTAEEMMQKVAQAWLRADVMAGNAMANATANKAATDILCFPPFPPARVTRPPRLALALDGFTPL